MQHTACAIYKLHRLVQAPGRALDRARQPAVGACGELESGPDVPNPEGERTKGQPPRRAAGEAEVEEIRPGGGPAAEDQGEEEEGVGREVELGLDLRRRGGAQEVRDGRRQGRAEDGGELMVEALGVELGRTGGGGGGGGLVRHGTIGEGREGKGEPETSRSKEEDATRIKPAEYI